MAWSVRESPNIAYALSERLCTWECPPDLVGHLKQSVHDEVRILASKFHDGDVEVGLKRLLGDWSAYSEYQHQPI